MNKITTLILIIVFILISFNINESKILKKLDKNISKKGLFKTLNINMTTTRILFTYISIRIFLLIGIIILIIYYRKSFTIESKLEDLALNFYLYNIVFSTIFSIPKYRLAIIKFRLYRMITSFLLTEFFRLLYSKNKDIKEKRVYAKEIFDTFDNIFAIRQADSDIYICMNKKFDNLTINGIFKDNPLTIEELRGILTKAESLVTEENV